MVRTRTAWLIGGVALAPVLLIVGGITATSGAAPSATVAGPALSPVGVAEVSGDPAAVVTALQQRLERLPLDHAAWAQLGQAYLAQARFTADPSYYDRAEQAFAQSISVSPDGNADALAGEAALANARHDFGVGRDLAEQAVAVDPYDAAAKGVLADALIELGAYDEARVTLQEMADLRPGVPALTRVSYLYELQGDPDNARALLDRALAAAGSDAEYVFAVTYLGRLALSTGDYSTAVEHFDEGLRLDAGNAELLAGRGAALAAIGDFDQAVADYAAAVQRLPSPTYVVEYAELLDSVGRGEEADQQFAVAEAGRRLFDAAGVTPDTEVALAEADHGDPERAVTIAEQQAATRDSVVVSDALAWALHAAGRSDEALPHAERAQRIGTRNALWDYHRGMIQLELGMTNEARQSLEQALATSPEFSPLHAPVARQALAELAAP